MTRHYIVRCALCGWCCHVVEEGQVAAADQATGQAGKELGQRHLHAIGTELLEDDA